MNVDDNTDSSFIYTSALSSRQACDGGSVNTT